MMKTKQNEELELNRIIAERSRLIIQFFWGLVIVSFGVTLFTHGLLTATLTGGTAFLIVGALDTIRRMNWMPEQYPYVITLILGILTFVLTYADPSITVIIAFAALLTIYPTYKPLLVYGVISFGVINWFILNPNPNIDAVLNARSDIEYMIPYGVLLIISFLSQRMLQSQLKKIKRFRLRKIRLK